MSFKNILKKVRQDNNLTQEELAKKINISRSNIANYENGKNMPSIEILNKLAEVLNVTTDYLLGNSNIMKPDDTFYFDTKKIVNSLIQASKSSFTDPIDTSNLTEKILNMPITSNLVNIPILGRVPAGEPLLAAENIEGYIPLDPSMYGIDKPDGFFFLVVQGESMNRVVTNGAYVLVRKQDYADDNDVVVAIVNGDDEVTLKRFKDLGNGFIELKPESTYSEFSSRIVNTKDTSFKVLGKVIGDFKKW